MAHSKFSELLIATYNPGKILELESWLGQLTLRLRGLAEFPFVQEMEETGATFIENAVIKATGYARQTSLWTLADDSGLEVEALGGAPGVYSARYAGPEASDAQRVERLLKELAETNDAQRRARFVCVIAIADPAAQVAHVVEGLCEGHLTHAPRGTGGFGYDPIFVPEGYEQSFGELPAEIKRSISHRARALAAAESFLRQRLRP
ncbi:MAG: XTP/dITP diphosphohydrolase [Blastocatellia bacterium]|jgi:XTP/dITP diphosphohydrolase|nr:XTP/dITP diphosphohydrolase [Blastocatellia bacterium]